MFRLCWTFGGGKVRPKLDLPVVVAIPVCSLVYFPAENSLSEGNAVAVGRPRQLPSSLDHLGAAILQSECQQVAVEAKLGSNAAITVFDAAYLNANGQL